MITTNLLDLVDQLNILGDVTVHDGADSIELHMTKPVDLDELDDLVCDALFVDPIARKEGQYDWTIELWKRGRLRGSSDMRVVNSGGAFKYVLELAA